MFVDHRMVEMRCAGRFCFVFFLFSLQNASSHLFPFHLDLCCCFKAISLVGVKPEQALSILDFLFFARCLEKFSVTSQTNLTNYEETEYVNEILGCDHSNKTSLAVLSHCVVFSILRSEMWKFCVGLLLRVKGAKLSKWHCKAVKQ